MKEPKHKLLIIDDQYHTRQKAYRKVLANAFEITWVTSSVDIYSIIEKVEPDAYIVDVMLHEWLDPSTSKPMDTERVLSKLKKHIPVILVSNEFGNLLRDDELTSFMNSLINQKIYYTAFLTWGQFTDPVESGPMDPGYMIVKNIQLIIRTNQATLDRQSQPEQSNHIKIGIVTALDEEIKPFLDNFKSKEIYTLQLGSMGVRKTSMKTKNGIVLDLYCATQNRMGTVDASIIGTALINEYKIQYLFMIGVCGGRQKAKVKIGDIIIPNSSVAYQYGKINDKGKFEARIGEADSYKGVQQGIVNSPKEVNAILRRIPNGFNREMIKNKKNGLSLGISTLYYDEMGCGDVVVSEKGRIDQIAIDSAKGKLCGVEMESYGILRISDFFPTVHSCVIKSVMDNASRKNDAHKEYACYAAANFLHGCFKKSIFFK